ncbi:MAG: U32 family peptidase [Phaeovulum sp.]|uniref:ubiquinone anaerobic biosynthesis protein UbiV n=1 Tax=Phaeovulum sp. TaxID=2934796 RepID=UPI0027371F1D|nr:U32 family peptidase [Phaeovulum sp.]MDP3861155.1 U32 family peptidase [Phaeovulum sp.]
MAVKPMQSLTLGPVIYHWKPEERRDFYARIADEAPVGAVYLGEVICSKRTPYFEGDYPDIIERLERGGKKVVLSSLSEVVLKREREMLAAICETEGHEIEINNTAGLLDVAERPHRVGPLMNIYNDETMRYLAGKGATHFSLPVELPAGVVGEMAKVAKGLGVGVEVQVFGRASLAVSARCYHARAHCRTKDNCQFVCEEDPDGMPLKTVTGQAFLTINGIQTLSHSYVNLVGEIDAMQAMGVSHFRLLPQRVDMVAVAGVFADRVAGRIDAAEASARLDALSMPAPFSNGFWHGQQGRRQFGPKVA